MAPVSAIRSVEPVGCCFAEVLHLALASMNLLFGDLTDSERVNLWRLVFVVGFKPRLRISPSVGACLKGFGEVTAEGNQMPLTGRPIEIF